MKSLKSILLVFTIGLSLIIFSEFHNVKAKNKKEAVKILRKTSIRDGAGPFYNIVSPVSANTEATVVKQNNKWILVKLKNGKQGWVSKRVLEKPLVKKDPFAKLALSKGVGSVSKTDVVAATKGLFDLNIKKADPEAKKVLRAMLLPQFTAVEYEEMTKNKQNIKENTVKKLENHFINSAEANDIGEELEIEIGKAMALRMINQGIVNDKTMNKRINLMGSLLASNSARFDLAFRFAVLNTKENSSFALPGGFIFITKGLMEKTKSNAELAGLLAHEISHVVLNHGMSLWTERKTERRSQDLFSEMDDEMEEMGEKKEEAGDDFENMLADAFKICTGKRSKKNEEIADYYGMYLAYKSGYAPEALGKFIKREGEKIEKESQKGAARSKKLLDSKHIDNSETHYTVEKRVEMINKFLKKMFF